jgi:hypothetical protein
MQEASQHGFLGRIRVFLRRHPVICLLLLSPGIPEYLSSSSPINALVLNPGMFLFQLAANLALYGPGVLLVREAMIRWRKGWGSVLALGAAYGILEEGVALSTLFNPNANPVGKLGYYGHYLGVNWIWTAGILPVHMIYSISLPILLLGMALPETRGKSLLTRRKILGASTILATDVVALFLLVTFGQGFWMGLPVLVSSFVAMALLVYGARRLRPDALRARTAEPKAGPFRLGLAGVAFYPAVLLTEFLGEGVGLWPAVDLALVVLVQALFLAYILRVAGSENNERNLIALALGLILPIAAFGVLAELALPLTLFLDLVMVLFFRKLWRAAPSTPA